MGCHSLPKDANTVERINMTEGISKERLLEIAKAPINKNNEELQFILRWLITTECAELDPWLPIDENTPKDKETQKVKKIVFNSSTGNLTESPYGD